MVRCEFESRSQILLMEVSGFWSLEEVRGHFAKLQACAVAARRAAGHLKVLIDARRGEVQASEISSDMTGFDVALLPRTDDRLAVLVASSIVKLQCKRMLRSENSKAFLSEPAARTWLLAHAPSIAARPVAA